MQFIDLHHFESGEPLTVNPNFIASIEARENNSSGVLMHLTAKYPEGIMSLGYHVRESREEVLSASRAVLEHFWDMARQKTSEEVAELLNPKPQKHAAKEARA